jgi:hypothetical protein
MATDIFYGSDVECRIGRRATINDAPTSWQRIEFMQATFTPNQEWRERPKLGAPATRHNSLDPVKPRKAFFRLGAEIVLDADTRQLPLWLRYGMGAPGSAANASLYNHTWNSGAKAEQYFDLQIGVGTTDIRVFECLTLDTLSTQFGGENTQDFNISLRLMGLRRRRETAFLGSAPTALPTESPILRARFLADDVAAANTLSASWSFGRSIQEGIFLSDTPTISSLRPDRPEGAASPYTGSAQVRAIGGAYDTLEEAGTAFKAALRLAGVVTNHAILFENPTALLQPSPMPVIGPGEIERTFNWQGHQTSSLPAARIVVTNDVASYT